MSNIDWHILRNNYTTRRGIMSKFNLPNAIHLSPKMEEPIIAEMISFVDDDNDVGRRKALLKELMEYITFVADALKYRIGLVRQEKDYNVEVYWGLTNNGKSSPLIHLSNNETKVNLKDTKFLNLHDSLCEFLEIEDSAVVKEGLSRLDDCYELFSLL